METTTNALTSEYANGGARECDAEARLGADRIIFISGNINDETARYTAAKLMLMDKASDEDITICIQSPGGSIDAGMIICDMMSLVSCDIRTLAIGNAASMGAIIFASGTKGKRYMLPSSRLMIHEPLTGFHGWVSTSEIVAGAESMKLARERISEFLAEATGQSVETIKEDIKTDKFFNAKEAVDYGLADKILDRESYRDLMVGSAM